MMYTISTLLLFTTGALSITISGNNDCSGVFFADSSYTSGACCIGGTIPAPYLSTCAGWPICSGPVTTTVSSKPLTCATVIASDSDYSSNLAKATQSLSASGTHYQTTFFVGSEGAAVSSTASASASASASSAASTGAGEAASTTGSSGAAGTMVGLGVAGSAVLLLAALL